MVSYENIHNYIQNYQWWIENIAKHYNDPDIMWSPMFLQVRNDGWTDETIDGDLQKFAEHLGQGDDDEYLLKTPCADLIRLRATPKDCNSINCSMPNTLTINCANLKISPCHRLTYNSLAGGEFEVENDKIVGIKSLPILAIATPHLFKESNSLYDSNDSFVKSFSSKNGLLSFTIT